MKRHATHFASVAGARTVTMLLSAVTFPFVVRMVGIEGFGRWSYVLAVVGFCELATNPGLVAFAAREVAARRLEANSVVADVFALRTVLGSAGSVLLAAYAWTVESDPQVRSLLLLYGVPMLLLGAVQSAYLLTATERFHWASLQQMVSQGLYAAAVFALVRSEDDLATLALATLASAALSSAVGWIELSRLGYALRWSWVPAKWADILRHSLPLGAASLASQAYTRSGHIVVKWALGETALGLYSAVIRLVEIVHGFVAILFGLLMPRMALHAHDANRRRLLLRNGFAVTWAVSVPLAVGGSLLAPELATAVLGPQYAAAGELLRIASFYLLANSLSVFFAGTVLYALGLRHRYLAATAAGAAFGIVANVTLIPAFGAGMACTIFVSSQLVVAAVAWLTAPDDARCVWRGRLVAAPLAASAAMALVLGILPGGVLDVWQKVALGAALYALAVVVLAHREVGALLREPSGG